MSKGLLPISLSSFFLILHFFAYFQDDLDLPVKIKAGHIGKTFFYAPAIFNGGHIVSPLSICTSVSSIPVRNTNGFCAMSFEKIGLLD